MSKTQKKKVLLLTQPRCKECGCKMVVHDNPIFGQWSNEAILKENNILMCFQCHHVQIKKDEVNRLPLLKRWRKKIDIATNIFSWCHGIRKLYYKLMWVYVRGQKLKGRCQQ